MLSKTIPQLKRGSAREGVCAWLYVCGLWWKGALRKTSKLNAIVLTSMDASKRAGITQSSPLKIPYKSLTERRLSPVFTSGLTEDLRAGGATIRSKLVTYDRYCVTMFLNVLFASCSSIQANASVKASDTLGKIKAQVKASWGLRALRCLLFGSYWPYECDASGGGPQRPSDPGWVPPTALSSCSGWKDKEGIPYRPDLQPPPPSERGVKGQINWLPMAHCLQQGLITY